MVKLKENYDKNENDVTRAITKLENTLKSISRVQSGGAVPFSHMGDFEGISMNQAVLYYAGTVQGSDGPYQLVIFATKKKDV